MEKNEKIEDLEQDNRSVFKKSHDLELENERLEVKLEESISCVNELKFEKESL